MTAQHPPEINLNLNGRGLTQSVTLAINERRAELRREGRQIYKLGPGYAPQAHIIGR